MCALSTTRMRENARMPSGWTLQVEFEAKRVVPTSEPTKSAVYLICLVRIIHCCLWERELVGTLSGKWGIQFIVS